ncbi:hypothetical protein HYFRA_00001038 [Hymenoscyphus fraxineus]|uniref:Uncharacterized protein n=1 Tax=Hymenoscyphus fraxineus TaxID=746836 RepID=A0A9N9PGW4_9HELO|nr:hypothetical protein HYFRA_00001038 [Hymenoscyphus fraxineus]
MTGPAPSNQNTTSKTTDGKESDKKNKDTTISNKGAGKPGMHDTKATQNPGTSHDHSHRFRKFCHRHCIVPGHHHEGSDKAVPIPTINVSDTTPPGKEKMNASTSKGSENAEKLSPKVVPKASSRASAKTAKRKPSANSVYWVEEAEEERCPDCDEDFYYDDAEDYYYDEDESDSD